MTDVTKEPSEDATIRTSNPKTVIKICKSGIPSDPKILARSREIYSKVPSKDRIGIGELQKHPLASLQ